MEFEKFLESLVKEQTALSEESIDKFVSLQLFINPPNFEVVRAVLAIGKDGFSDLCNVIVAHGPIICESLAKCKDALQAQENEIVTRFSESFDKFSAYNDASRVAEMRDALELEFGTRLSQNLISFKDIYRMVFYLQLITKLESMGKNEKHFLLEWIRARINDSSSIAQAQ